MGATGETGVRCISAETPDHILEKSPNAPVLSSSSRAVDALRSTAPSPFSRQLELDRFLQKLDGLHGGLPTAVIAPLLGTVLLAAGEAGTSQEPTERGDGDLSLHDDAVMRKDNYIDPADPGAPPPPARPGPWRSPRGPPCPSPRAGRTRSPRWRGGAAGRHPAPARRSSPAGPGSRGSDGDAHSRDLLRGVVQREARDLAGHERAVDLPAALDRGVDHRVKRALVDRPRPVVRSAEQLTDGVLGAQVGAAARAHVTMGACADRVCSGPSTRHTWGIWGAIRERVS